MTKGPRKGRIELIGVFYERFTTVRLDDDWIGKTDIELSELIGVHANNIARWKDGRGLPDAIALVQIADVFNVSIDWLLGRTDK